MSTLADRPVVVVGAGLAGLSCAVTLHEAGAPVVVIESGDDVGGRVRTDEVDGFLLDRGFQVLLTAYPELDRQLDIEALELELFDPGALIHTDDRFWELGDPLQRPASLIPTLRTAVSRSVATPGDLIRLLALRLRLSRTDVPDLLRGPDVATIDALTTLGFSNRSIQRFFRPLVGGIQLDPSLHTSARMFDTILKMLFTGRAAVPRHGMKTISQQLGSRLPSSSVHLHVPVRSVTASAVRVDSGEIDASAVVVATDGNSAAELLGRPRHTPRSAGCVWFDAPEAPTDRRLIVLDGDRSGPVANVAVMSNVSSRYAPPGRHLIAAAAPGFTGADLEQQARSQLTSWWGSSVQSWTTLRVDEIEYGQPDQTPHFSPKRSVEVEPHLYVCGDHRDTGSIQGALYSGRRCAEAILQSRT
jgi:phytoene dehydrogenase-like protein